LRASRSATAMPPGPAPTTATFEAEFEIS